MIPGLLLLSALVAPSATSSAAATRYCAVCDNPIQGLAAQRTLGGRKILVHADCAAAFDRSPAKFASRVLPQGALFQEAPLPQSPVGRGWLYFALYVVAGLCFGGICAYLAIDRGRSGKAWFALGFLTSPVALAVLLVRPRLLSTSEAPGLAKVPTTREPVPCGECGSANHPSSARCAGCGRALEPSAPSEVAAVGSS